MKRAILLLAVLVVGFSFAGKKDKFGDLTIFTDEKESAKWSSCAVAHDSSSELTIYTGMKLLGMPIAQNSKRVSATDMFVFESGNPLAGSLAVTMKMPDLTTNLGNLELQMVMRAKMLAENSSLTADQIEYLLTKAEMFRVENKMKK